MAEKTILFVCTGNTCRSVMAEAMAKEYLAQLKQEKPKVRVMSAGTGAIPGEPASEYTLAALSHMGINFDGHKARSIRPELIGEADVILVMTNRHKEHILNLAPDAKNKVYLLKAYASDNEEKNEDVCDDGNAEIMDPFGLSLGHYRVCAGQLQAFVNKALDRLFTDK